MRMSDAATIAAGTPGTELMARAGRGIFEAAAWKPPVAVVCGTGNNAGDGYVLALLFHENDIPCTVFLLAEKWSADGRFYYDKCAAAGVEIRMIPEKPDFSAYGSVADCLFGTGFSGEVRGRAKDAIDAINRSGAYVISADINSGLSGDGGMAVTAVRSDLTVSVGAFQPGHFLNMAKDLMKEKVSVDIGIAPAVLPYRLAEPADLKMAFPPRKNFSNKSTYGYIGLIGGSAKYIGAVKLAALANAAMRGGAGVVKLAAPASLCASLRPEVLEATLFPLSDSNGDLVFSEEEMEAFTKGLKAVAFGMGAGLSDGTGRLLTWLLQNYTGKLVIDADGLNALAKTDRGVLKNAACRVLLTPHNMEFSRLSGHGIEEILADPIPLARAFAKETGTVLLLKGPATVVTDGERVLLTDRGCPGMATAGSGDVLSGVLAALCGYNDDLVLAAAAGAWLNGRAGELAQQAFGAVSMTAGDTAANLPRAVRELTDD
jgi:NAD(P)H-hydrate epimerase